MVAAVPASLTAFIGREEDVASLCRLLESTRLLTLTGAGGSGKTRLANEVAMRSAVAYADGVAWVELAPLADAELLPVYLLDVLGLEPGARAPMTALLDTLRDREMLLVLDNCEHIVEACANLVDAVLRGCPRVRIVATSREALGVSGERAWLVAGLALPSPETNHVDSIANAAAVRLFVDRAQSALATFRLSPSNASAVAQICRRLDGLPLAIELAAARVRTLPPEQLTSRLDDAFRVLASGSRTSVSRHRTLREAIEWSYNLLDDRERALLQRLSIFAGDFTLNAAESVGADARLDAGDVLDTLAALVDKSLVVMKETEGTARYYLLETIRQYGAARLRESGEYHKVCARHARTYMDLVAEAAPYLITRDRPEWVQRIHRELDNLRIALSCTRNEAIHDHLTLLGNMGWFWYSTGLWSEARRWYDAAIALPWTEEMGRARATVLLGAGVIASLQGGPDTAIPWLQESAELFRKVGDRRGESYALAYQGVSHGQRRDPRTVEPTMRALEWFRSDEDLYGVRLCLVVLSTYYGSIGEIERARATGQEAVEVARTYGLGRELAIALQVFAAVSMKLEKYSEAAELVRESMAALRRDPSLFWSSRGLQQLAVVHLRTHRAERGAFLLGCDEAARESIGSQFFGPDRALIEESIAIGRAELGDAAFDAAWKEGRAVSLEDMLDEEIRRGVAHVDTHPQPPAAAEIADVPPLDVRALGRLEILRDGRPMPSDAWRYAKPRELLLYLLSQGEGRTRDQIGVVFWPDASAAQVKNSFHVMLHHVRKAIGRADLIVFDGDRYRIAWETGITFDARTFEENARSGMRALKSARGDADTRVALETLGAVLDAYGGDFLAGVDAGDWHLEIRERLRRLFGDAAMLLGDRHLQRGENREAADAFRRAVQVDELHEEAHRRLMLALTRAGERSEALKQYERLSRVLLSDLEAEPERETKALYERLRRAETV